MTPAAIIPHPRQILLFQMHVKVLCMEANVKNSNALKTTSVPEESYSNSVDECVDGSYAVPLASSSFDLSHSLQYPAE